MKRLGILGGSFDPVHIGHLIAAECVREAFQLDQVLFVPAYQPPHKSGAPKASAAVRLKMVEGAIRSHIGFAVSDIEIRRQGPSYTFDTLQELSRTNPGARLYFILGSDLLPDIVHWHKWETLIGLATFVGVRRPGAPAQKIPDLLLDAVKQIDIPAIDVSSTLIRARVAEGKSIRYLVPGAVQDIIEEERLYRDGNT